MSLPPILSGLPIFRIFAKKDNAQAEAVTRKDQTRTAPKDIVDISSKALDTPKNSADARVLAVRTSDLLYKSGMSLGIDPKFQE